MATSVKRTRTYVAKPAELNPRWHLFDASQAPLGRLAVQIATILQGKHRPTYTANINTGDFVVVVNSAKAYTTGKKREQKVYQSHSGYQGGLKTVTLGKMLERTPNRVIVQAVWGMLPKTSMGRHMLKRMKVYAGPNHPHQAQITGYAPGPADTAGRATDS